MIAICGVTYNRLDLVRQWIKSIFDNFPPGAKFYLADNGSKDGTKEFLALIAKDPRVACTMLHDKNIGKGSAMNMLFKVASRTNMEYMVSSDSDIVVGQGWWNQLISIHKKYKETKNIGWISPIYHDDNNPIPHSREDMCKMGKESGDYIDNIGVAGGFFLFPIKMYRDVGGYVNDNRYGGVDGTYLHVCRKGGYRCGYTTRCVVKHLRGGKEYDDYEVWKRKIQKNLKKHGVFNYKVSRGYWDE